MASNKDIFEPFLPREAYEDSNFELSIGEEPLPIICKQVPQQVVKLPTLLAIQGKAVRNSSPTNYVKFGFLKLVLLCAIQHIDGFQKNQVVNSVKRVSRKSQVRVLT